jgi:hypothetical protein
MTIFFRELVHNRPNSIHENVCLAGKAGMVSFVQGAGEPSRPDYCSGIRENLLTKTGGSDIVESGKTVQKAAFPLAEVLDKHGAPAVIDYGAFDIEGSELEVLEPFPFSRYTFRAMSLECDASVDRFVSPVDGRRISRGAQPLQSDAPVGTILAAPRHRMNPGLLFCRANQKLVCMGQDKLGDVGSGQDIDGFANLLGGRANFVLKFFRAFCGCDQ